MSRPGLPMDIPNFHWKGTNNLEWNALGLVYPFLALNKHGTWFIRPNCFWAWYSLQVKEVCEGHFPAGNYMFKVNNRNKGARCETCLKSTINTPEQRHRSGVVIVNHEHISHLVCINFEQVNVGWVGSLREGGLFRYVKVAKDCRNIY